MALQAELRHLTATLILDLEDRYARERGTRGRHPRPMGPVTYRLLGQITGGQREDFDPPLELVVVRNPSGYDLCFGRTRSSDGPTRLLDGTYVLRVDSPHYQPVEQQVDLPQPAAAYFFDLLPSYAYPFPSETLPGGRGPTLLRGEYLARDGSGVAGVTVLVPGRSAPYITDASGRWVLFFPDDQPTGDVTVRFQGPGGTETVQVVIVAGRASSLRQTALRGFALTTAGVPIGGATITVAGQPAPIRSGPDGGWSCYFPLAQPPAAGPVDVTASLPDGRSQTHPSIGVQPRSTVVVPTFRL
jgi:hypothetical protein